MGAEEDQLKVLGYLRDRAMEGGPWPRDSDVNSALGWTQDKTIAVLRVLSQRREVTFQEFFATGPNATLIQLTEAGHRRLDKPTPAGQHSVSLHKVKNVNLTVGDGASQAVNQERQVDVRTTVSGGGFWSWLRGIFTR